MKITRYDHSAQIAQNGRTPHPPSHSHHAQRASGRSPGALQRSCHLCTSCREPSMLPGCTSRLWGWRDRGGRDDRARRAGSGAPVRVAFDSRPSADPRGVGRYARCLLRALRDTAGARGEIVETHRPRRADVFHAPWMQGAMLHSPCPMIVTIHDLDALKRPSERCAAVASISVYAISRCGAPPM